ncbi:MAG: HEAT repeat domain-containing protein [Candidatus Limnocylindria bacterium]
MLAEKLRKARNARVASAAAWALGMSGNRAAVRHLLMYLQRPNADPLVRGHVCEALGVLGSSAAVPLLLDQLRDTVPDVRYWAVYALGALQADSALPILQQMARSDRGMVVGHGSVRAEAKWAIQQIRRRSTPRLR